METSGDDTSGLKRHADRLVAKGDEEAERILAEAKKKCDEDIRKAKEDAERLVKASAEKGAIDAARLENQELSSAELDAKKMRLVAQKEVLDSVLRAALKRLGDLPPEKRRAILGRLLIEARGTLPKGRAYARPEDLTQVSSAGYSNAGPLASSGGVIIESEDGRVRLDLRYETVLHYVWAKHTKEIVSLLFK